MNIATKTIANMLAMASTTVKIVHESTGAGARSLSSVFPDRRLMKVLQKHDRKMELRASVLGISPAELRYALRKTSFEKLIKQAGFGTKENYLVALIGRLREELRQRGWDSRKIEDFVSMRGFRYAPAL